MGTGLTVACVLWHGDFRQRAYTPEWVRRLRNMVARNLRQPHRFVCLSNVAVEGVETIPLTGHHPGWWAKTELFAYELGDRTLYLDLDTLVVGDLTDIVDYPSAFALMPPSYTLTGGKPAGGEGVVDRYQSSVMVWSRGEGKAIWDRFDDGAKRLYRGDQDWIGSVEPNRDTMPTDWFRKLKDCQDGPPASVKVVLSMPWKNADAARKFKWVAETWC